MNNSQEAIVFNQNALHNLRRAVSLGQGQFSLILARSNYTALSEAILSALSAHLQLDLVTLSPGVTSLIEAIEKGARVQQPINKPRAVVVRGLETIPTAGDAQSALAMLLKAANLGRDELTKRVPVPVLLWISDWGLNQLNRYAPDLKSFAATPIRFELPISVLTSVLARQAMMTYCEVLAADTGLSLGPKLPYPVMTSAPLAPRELTFAMGQLEQIPGSHAETVPPDLIADVFFLQGRNLQQQGQLEAARTYYEKSLDYWQQRSAEPVSRERLGFEEGLNAEDKLAVLLFHMGLWWRAYGVLRAIDYESACESARQAFERALAIFRRQGRSDRVGRFLLALAEVLEKLKDWPALADVAQTGVQLHQRDLPRLARDYGFLAQVALAQAEQVEGASEADALSEAQGFAQQALEISDRAITQVTQALPTVGEGQSGSAEMAAMVTRKMALRYHRGRYFYLLAQAQAAQQEYAIAIENLERTLQHIDPRYDLPLYRQALNRLRTLYFEQGHYAEAFEIKLEQRRVETLFGLRAFIGADPLPAVPPQMPVRTWNQHRPKTPATLMTEMAASGRITDVEALLGKLAQPRYPIVVIHGQSGVGKSSLLRVGLMPRLWQLTPEGRATLPILIKSYRPWSRAIIKGLGLSADEETAAGASEVILADLRQRTQGQFQQVALVFDQFEDFFYEFPTVAQRQALYRFLRECLTIPYVKIVLALREDFLHYLLEWDRQADLSAVDNDILSKDIRYYLGNFSPQAAEQLILQLTRAADYYPDEDLISALVDDLAADTGEVRPIELQVVGAQMQRQQITTLSDYRALGASPKLQLLKAYLAAVVEDCGPENETIAQSVLHLLSQGENRPLKSLAELQEPLALANIDGTMQQMRLVLEILVGSGLVFELPEVSGVRYQLAHEYLAQLVKEQNHPSLVTLLQTERQRRTLTEAQLEKALLAQSDSRSQAAHARQQARTAEIRALISLARSLRLSGDGLESLVKAMRAARQVQQQGQASAQPLLAWQCAIALHLSLFTLREIQQLEGHTNWIWSVAAATGALEAQGAQWISASEDGTLRLWDAHGNSLKTLEGPAQSAVVMASGDQGKMLLSAGLAQPMRLWTFVGENIRSSIVDTGKVASVTALAISPVDSLAAVAYSDTTVLLLSPGDGEASPSENRGSGQITLSGHEDWVQSVAFSPDGEMIATGSEDMTVRLWERDGQLLQCFEHRGAVRAIAFSPDGQQLISGGDEGALRIWSTDGFKLATMYGHEDWVRAVAYSPDGNHIASASDDQTVRIWDAAGRPQQVWRHLSRVNSLAWAADSQSLCTGGEDDQVHVWSLHGPATPVGRQHRGIVWTARWRPGESAMQRSQLVSAGADDRLIRWNEAGEMVSAIAAEQRGVHCLDWRPDGAQIATAGADYSVHIFRADGTRVRQLRGHGDAVWRVSYSPNGKQLATVSSDRTIRIWSEVGQLLSTWGDHTDTVWSVAWHADGEYLVTASEDKTLRLWHREEGLMQTVDSEGALWCAAFSPDRRFVAAGGADGTVRLWKLGWQGIRQMRIVGPPRLLKGHRDWVRAIAFSPDGQLLASASDDNSIRLWPLWSDVLAGAHAPKGGDLSQLLPVLEGHEGVVWDVDFDWKGQRLVSASADGTVRIWDFRLESLMERGCSWLADWLEKQVALKEQICPEKEM